MVKKPACITGQCLNHMWIPVLNSSMWCIVGCKCFERVFKAASLFSFFFDLFSKPAFSFHIVTFFSFPSVVLLFLSPCSSLASLILPFFLPFFLNYSVRANVPPSSQTLSCSLMGSRYLAQNMPVVWCNGPVPTNAIVHGGLADPSEAMPVLLPSVHTRTSVIIKQSLSSGELIELQERPGTHPPTVLLPPPPPSVLSAQWGVSKHIRTHIHTRHPPPAEKTASVLCFRVISAYHTAFSAKTGRLIFSWAFTLTKTSRPHQSVWRWHTKNTQHASVVLNRRSVFFSSFNVFLNTIEYTHETYLCKMRNLMVVSNKLPNKSHWGGSPSKKNF